MRSQLFALLVLPFIASTFASMDGQIPLSGSDFDEADSTTPITKMAPSLADLLTIENSASIFYSYARETHLSELFDDDKILSTLLVPTNRAVMALARKPHQGPAPIDEGIHITEEEYDSRSRRNVENWVSAHIIPQSPISLTSELDYQTLLEGCTVAVRPIAGDVHTPEWTRVVLNGNISIISQSEASNGMLYLIDIAIYG